MEFWAERCYTALCILMLHSLVHSFFKNVRLLLGLLGKGRCMERLGCGLGVGAISVQSNDLDP